MKTITLIFLIINAIICIASIISATVLILNDHPKSGIFLIICAMLFSTSTIKAKS